MAKHLMRPLDRTSYPAGAEDYAPHILGAWLRAFPDSEAKDRDKEDWVENACFIEAFEKLGVEYKILDTAAKVWISSVGDSMPDSTGERAFFHSGIMGHDHAHGVDFDLAFQKSNALKIIGEHATSPVFQKAAGRSMELVKPCSQAVDEAIRKIIPEAGEVFIKTIKKETAGRYKIEAGTSPWRQICEQDENLIWSIIQYEGLETPYFSIQEVIEPTYEYRMFMVGDKPVTGAGCVEAFTPLDNEDVFDPKMEERRNRSKVEHRGDLVDRYLAFALDYGKAFAAENGTELVYSLDLCVDAKTGKVVAIELNPPFNLGRYASQIEPWVLAIDAQLGNDA